ncbi:MAG: arsenate reductase (glutaredoxin) [Methylococcaceae bacterium]|nr:arsenate reductase (glutaredoxin) [Methylococcaceae bacterium]
MPVKIYHNPRCTKSRQTLQLLKDRGVEPEIIEYLKTPPSVEELTVILNKLGMQPRDLIRKQEAEYKSNGLDNKEVDNDCILRVMVENPILIERPIVVTDTKAVIGRPPENVLDLL